jgi:hypothetical protein
MGEDMRPGHGVRIWGVDKAEDRGHRQTGKTDGEERWRGHGVRI